MFDHYTALSFLRGRPARPEELSDFANAEEWARLPIELLGKNNLAQIPGIDRETLARMPEAKGFFTAAELCRLVPAGREFLEAVVDFPKLVVADARMGSELAFEPVADRYVVDGRTDPDSLAAAGYRVTMQGEGGATLAIVDVADEFMSSGRAPRLDMLKHATRDLAVLPVMRDREGRLRYLVPNRLDVWFERNVPRERALAILEEAGLGLLPGRESERHVGLWRSRIEVRAANSLRAMTDALRILRAHDEVLLAEPDEIGMRDFAPMRVSSMWAASTDFTSALQDWNRGAIHLDEGHTVTRGSSLVKLFVIDSGIDTDHPNVARSLWSGWATHDLNFSILDPHDATSPEAFGNAHGTAVASLATGQGGSGPLGVAPECVLVPIKIAGVAGSAGYGLRAAAIHQALDLIGSNERGVINLSWRTAGMHQGIREAIRRAERMEVPVVVAAGNYFPWEMRIANEDNYPAAHVHREPVLSNLCSVGAVDAALERADYSYFGDASITVAAPGGETGGIGTGILAATLDGDMAYVEGTSFAAPQVAGLLGLILSRQPDIGASDAIALLRNTAAPLASSDFSLGAGLIRVDMALSQSEQGGVVGGERTGSDGALIVEGRLLNVNRASIDELAALAPLSRWHAEGIVSHRDSHGHYPSLWHLVTCGRVDFAMIAKLKPVATV